MFQFTSLFPQQRDTGPRNAFLSRLFGIFSEDIARMWFTHSDVYENLGRPTIRRVGAAKGYTLDFTVRDRRDQKVYVGEMKCEIAYDGYKYLTLTTPKQLAHHAGEAFRFFLDSVRNPQDYAVTVGGRPQPIDGAILVWGHCTEEGRASVQGAYGLRTVLSLQEMINDLLQRENQEYLALIRQRQAWCNELFDGLGTPPSR